MDVSDGPIPGECSGWKAWHDHEPPGPETLKVTGECKFPTPGYKVELRRHEPQGTYPENLLLERIVKEPEGQPRVITTELVRYEEETDVEYVTVTILSDGVTVLVDHPS